MNTISTEQPTNRLNTPNLLSIPLDAAIADQQLDINLEGKALTLRVTWNSTAAYWYMSLFMRDGGVILHNIKLVSDTSLLSRYALPSLQGDLILLDKNSGLDRPTFTSLGVTHRLVYLPPGGGNYRNFISKKYIYGNKGDYKYASAHRGI